MIVAVDGVEHFVGLFEHEAAQRLIVCSRSHGQPSGPRSRAMISTSRRNSSAARRRSVNGVHRGDYASISTWRIRKTSGVTFTGFILSLATTAAVHFRRYCRSRHRRTAARPNLAAAAQMIELIALLQEKTKGNLIEPEAQARRRPALRTAACASSRRNRTRSASSSPDPFANHFPRHRHVARRADDRLRLRHVPLDRIRATSALRPSIYRRDRRRRRRS